MNNLTATGVTVTPPARPAAPSPTLTQQRSFTFGFEYSDNYLLGAEGSGVFSELGGLLRVNFDAFIDDERFFEKDGLTYVKVPTGLAADDGGDYRVELGWRFRLSNGEMKFANNRGGNVDDLLLFEMVYRYSGATEGLRTDTNTANRFTWRAIATPRIHKPKDTEANTIKAVIGVEVDRDLKMKGPMDVKLFYGTNINLEALFK